MKIKTLLRSFTMSFGIAAVTAAPAAPAPAVLDTRPAFMQIVTNFTRLTNVVVVTNYVVLTNVSYTTNLYNAQGQLLLPVKPAAPPIPGLIPIPPAAAMPAGPDPAAVKASQMTAVGELLLQSVWGASNKVCAADSFSGNAPRAIRMPEGVTSFDRKKGQAFLTAMNTAATKAAPEAVKLVAQAVAGLKPSDPAAILKGENDAATAFLLNTAGEDLTNRILAVVQRAAAEAKVQDAYRSVMLKGGGLLGAVLGTGPAVDTDAHITKGLIAAIFQEVAGQEKVIRADPAARKSKALQEALKK